MVVDRSTPTEVDLELGHLQDHAPVVQIELIRQALGQLGCGERALTEWHYARILALAASKEPAGAVSLPHGFLVRRRTDHMLHIGRPTPPPDPDRGPASLQVPGQVRWHHWVVDAAVLPLDAMDVSQIKGNTCRSSEWLDYDKLSPPLVVRRRRPGDRLRPLGQSTDKKVGKLLTDARIPPGEREDILVVEDQERIIWLCPVRMSDQAKVTRTTRQVVRLTIRRAQDTTWGDDRRS